MADWPYNTAIWQRLRRSKLSSQPLCEACSLRGAVRAANAVDHIKPISAGGDPFPPLEGLMALCVPCHSEKTAGVDRTGAKGVRFKGAGLAGMPIDPSHPFYSEGGIPPVGTADGAARTAAPHTKILSLDSGQG